MVPRCKLRQASLPRALRNRVDGSGEAMRAPRLIGSAPCRCPRTTGGTGRAVSRQEAEMLFHIHGRGREREGDGGFGDLLVKAIAHHLLAAGGAKVRARGVALAAGTPLDAWASVYEFGSVDREIAAWI